MITSFNHATCRALRDDLQNDLRNLEARYGIKFTVGAMKFTSAEVEIKVSANIVGAKTKAQADLESHLRFFNIAETNAKGDRLVEYKRANHRYPWIYINGTDGRRYKASTDFVERNFPKANHEPTKLKVTPL